MNIIHFYMLFMKIIDIVRTIFEYITQYDHIMDLNEKWCGEYPIDTP